MDCHCLINKTTPLVPAKGDKGDTVLAFHFRARLDLMFWHAYYA